MKFRKKLTKQLNVRVEDGVLGSIDYVAKEEGVSRKEVLRTFINYGLKQWQKQNLAEPSRQE